MTRRRSCDYDDDIDTTHLGAATPAVGLPKRAPRKAKEPIGFCIDPAAYKPKPAPKQRKRRKRGS